MSVGTQVCKLCGDKGVNLVRCHLYPRSMSRELAGPDNLLVAMSDRDGKPRTSYAPSGVYDDQIVCGNCERRFKDADDYGIEFRRRVIRLGPPFRIGRHGRSFPIFEARPAALHTFATQTWLRCHLSERTFDDGMRNEPMFSLVRDCILEGRSTLDVGPAVALMFDVSALGAVMLHPVLHDEPDYPVYELHLPNMAILIAASERGLPPAFDPIKLVPGGEVMVLRTKKLVEARLDYLLDTYLTNRVSVDRMMARTTRRQAENT